MDPNAMREVMSHQGATQREKIQQAGVQFEAIMLRQFLGDALKPSIKGSLDEEGSGNDTYRYFITDTLAQSLARQGVFGIGQQITQQLVQRTQNTAETSPTQPSTTGTAGAIKTKRL